MFHINKKVDVLFVGEGLAPPVRVTFVTRLVAVIVIGLYFCMNHILLYEAFVRQF